MVFYLKKKLLETSVFLKNEYNAVEEICMMRCDLRNDLKSCLKSLHLPGLLLFIFKVGRQNYIMAKTSFNSENQ